MYYIEFIDRKPGVSQERFHHVVRASTERWAREHPDDELILMIGRTWRLGPKPTYMTVWKIKGTTTLDEWSREFRTSTGKDNHAEFTEVATIVDAGLYEDLGNEVL